jgi:hypothetical protein
VRQQCLHLLRLGQLYQNSPPIVLDPSLYTPAQLSPAHSASEWRLSTLNSALASTVGSSSLHGGTLMNATAQQQSLNGLPALLVNERQNAFLFAMAPQPPVAVVAARSRGENPSQESSSKKRKL